MRRGLGMNITSDMVRDYFSPKAAPASLQQQQQQQPMQQVKYRVGSTSATTRAASGIATPHLSRDEVRYYEQIMTLSADQEDCEELYNENAPPISEMLLPEPDDDTPHTPQQQEISTEVYDNYSFEHNYDDTLPITDERQNVVQTIESNRVTIIQGSTGSGKTTQVPQYILDYYRCSQKYCNILVTQPRRIAAISVAKRVSHERNWQLGTLVGYQVARDRNVTEDTRITYMTTGVLLQKLIKNKSLGEYTHVILDEVHERDQDIDFCMLVVRKFLRNVSRHVKVVLMSATVDCSLFSKYFSILINGRQEGAPIIRVDGKMFDVDEYYFEDIAGLSEPPQQCILEPDIGVKCYRMCRELIMVLDKDEVQNAQAEGPMLEKRGTVLCFLPGLPEIKEMSKFLADIEDSHKLRVIPLHSSITTSEQNKVFITAHPYERKVILSTNIAESSITVPDIKYVIDFCLTKQNEVDSDTNYQRLTLKWASKASLTQRKGRAGRVSDGHCFRLISTRMFEDLEDYCTPEMKRAPLEQVILKVKLLELGPPAMILQLALEPPGMSDVKRTILMLKEVGALTVKQGDKLNPVDGDLTFVGRVLGNLPVDVYIGKLLLIGYAFGVLEECIVIGACLSLKSIFMQPFKEELKAYSNKMHWAKFSGSDLIASLNAFLSWKFRKEHKGFGMPENTWARKNMVEARRFREIDELIKELKDRLYSYNIMAPKNIFKTEQLDKNDELVLKLVIAGAFYPNYFQTSPIDEADAAKQMSGQSPFTSVLVSGAPPTLCHYRSKVAQLFRGCGRGRRIFFENSKTIIEFENDYSGDSPVAVAVYKAIKMRLLRIPMSIFVSKQRDDEYRHELVQKPLEAYNPETGLKTNRMNTGFNDKKGKFSVTLAGDCRQVEIKGSGYITIFIQEIVHPGQYWATYSDKDSCQLMYQLHEKINSQGGSNLKPLEKKDIYVGAYCLALFEDEYFRAEIKLSTNAGVQVFFVDYGNKVVVSPNDLKVCSEALLKTPFQAFLCELSETRPIHGTWTEESIARIKELVPLGSKEFFGKVYSCVYDVCRLELFDREVSINKLLIEEGHAQHQEENILSRRKHESAEIIQNNKQQQKVIREAADVRGDEEVLKITLRGPFSPYEVQFSGLTTTARMRSVTMGQDSVNSVVMCEEPQETRRRLLVAASISINNSGSAVKARETTLFPNIHGLNALLPLLFAPVAELRCDKNMTKYTGALCGLGCTDNGTAILPDHDMEIVFDVKFKDEDWTAINCLRYFINLAIGIEEERIDKAHKMMENIQTHARENLIKLVTAQREDMEPQTFQKEFQWNQNDPNDLLDPANDEVLQPKPCHLYMYHKGIFFEKEDEPLDPRIIEQRRQIEYFHSLSGDSLISFKSEVVCPICQVVCRHPRNVYYHTETAQHKNWVKSIFEDAGPK